MNGAPNVTKTYLCRFASLSYKTLHYLMCPYMMGFLWVQRDKRRYSKVKRFSNDFKFDIYFFYYTHFRAFHTSVH